MLLTLIIAAVVVVFIVLLELLSYALWNYLKEKESKEIKNGALALYILHLLGSLLFLPLLIWVLFFDTTFQKLHDVLFAIGGYLYIVPTGILFVIASLKSIMKEAVENLKK